MKQYFEHREIMNKCIVPCLLCFLSLLWMRNTPSDRTGALWKISSSNQPASHSTPSKNISVAPSPARPPQLADPSTRKISPGTFHKNKILILCLKMCNSLFPKPTRHCRVRIFFMVTHPHAGRYRWPLRLSMETRLKALDASSDDTERYGERAQYKIMDRAQSFGLCLRCSHDQ